MVMVRKVPLALEIRCSLALEYEGFFSSVLENVLGIDILQGRILQTSISEFHIQVKVIKPVLRGNAS